MSNCQFLLQRLYFLVFLIQAVAVIELFEKYAEDKHDNLGFSENNVMQSNMNLICNEIWKKNEKS